MIYDIGDGVALRHEVTDEDGNPTSATVAALVTKPSGATISPTFTATSLGVYEAEVFIADEAGPWRYRVNVTGAVTDVAYGSFEVAEQAPGLYATVPLVKASLGKLTKDDRDELIEQACRAASRMIDARTGRRFWRDYVPTARTFDPIGRTVRNASGVALLVDDIASTADLTVASGALDLTPGITYGPGNALALGRPVTLLRASTQYGEPFAGPVTVTARWGWPSVPDEVTSAATLLAARLYRRKDSPQGVIGSAEWGAIRVGRVDPDVEALISHFILPGFA